MSPTLLKIKDYSFTIFFFTLLRNIQRRYIYAQVLPRVAPARITNSLKMREGKQTPMHIGAQSISAGQMVHSDLGNSGLDVTSLPHIFLKPVFF